MLLRNKRNIEWKLVKLRLFSLSNVLVLYILHLYEWFCDGVQGNIIYVKYTMYIMTLSLILSQ